LWKYFEQVVNNMTEGQSGQNISRFAYEYYSCISSRTGVYNLDILHTRSLFQRQQIDANMVWDSCIKHKRVADSYNNF
jgi:hypothetical protein